MQWEGNPNTQEAGQIRPAYRAFLERFEPETAWLTGENTPGCDRAVVIIDDRQADPMLRRVMNNFHHFLGDGWNWHFWPLFGEGDPVPRLNKMLLSSFIWEQMPEEHLLFIQRDTICCRPLDPKYLDYDFIGAPCGAISPDKGRFDMNGGLSLRKRSAMLKALAHTPAPEGMPEDVFFSRVLRSMNATLPAFGTACHFSLENEPFYTGLPFGVHGTDKLYHSDAIATQIVNQIALRESVTA